MTKIIFNARLQRETEYELEVDDNNEIVATCTETGDTLKFPNVSEAEFDELTVKHQVANLGQIVKKPLFGGQEAQPEVVVEELDETQPASSESTETEQPIE